MQKYLILILLIIMAYTNINGEPIINTIKLVVPLQTLTPSLHKNDAPNLTYIFLKCIFVIHNDLFLFQILLGEMILKDKSLQMAILEICNCLKNSLVT